MDLIVDLCDRAVLTPYVYPTRGPEDNLLRQTLSLFVILVVGAWVMYLSSATASFFLLFDHRLMKHPLFLENQVRLEVVYAMKSIPLMALFTVPIMLLEIRGYSKLYMGLHTWKDWAFIGLTAVAFLMFTDCLIYWLHRGLHSGKLYRYIHKDHHRWKVPSPFASHAFHPVDGWIQALPYHIYPFLFPLHKVAYLILFVCVNMWTVSIHDGNYRVPELLKPVINGSAHHTDHHLFFNYNYGQFFTLWDRIGGSFRVPSAFEGRTLLSALTNITKTE